MLGLYRASTWARGRLGIVISWNSDAAAAANALWRGVVGEGLGMRAGPGRQREREGSERATEGEGVRASGAGAGRLGRWWATAGPLVWAALGAGWRLRLFFGIREKKKI